MSATRELLLLWAQCRRFKVPQARFFPALPVGEDRDLLTEPLRLMCSECCPVLMLCAADALHRKVTHGFVASVDLGPGPDPQPGAVDALHQIAARLTTY